MHSRAFTPIVKLVAFVEEPKWSKGLAVIAVTINWSTKIKCQDVPRIWPSVFFLLLVGFYVSMRIYHIYHNACGRIIIKWVNVALMNQFNAKLPDLLYLKAFQYLVLWLTFVDYTNRCFSVEFKDPRSLPTFCTLWLRLKSIFTFFFFFFCYNFMEN